MNQWKIISQVLCKETFIMNDCPLLLSCICVPIPVLITFIALLSVLDTDATKNSRLHQIIPT